MVHHAQTDKTTSVSGVFAAGDCIYGTKSIIEAIQPSREATAQIDRYLGGDGDISGALAPVDQADSCISPLRGFLHAEAKTIRYDVYAEARSLPTVRPAAAVLCASPVGGLQTEKAEWAERIRSFHLMAYGIYPEPFADKLMKNARAVITALNNADTQGVLLQPLGQHARMRYRANEKAAA